jgi:hypothetical protein
MDLKLQQDTSGNTPSWIYQLAFDMVMVVIFSTETQNKYNTSIQH